MSAGSGLDRFGFPAFTCAKDGRPLELVDVKGDVLCCPACGHRTDEPGEGVLADGFDVVHRQWGLRGDPHVWNALRDLVGTTPTPPTGVDVRAAFVNGLSRVADVDVDHSDDVQVFRKQFDHGGMSGGYVDVVWWRTKGIPLLVERAVGRRPASSTRSGAIATRAPEAQAPARRLLGSLAIWLVLLAIPAALVGGGGWLLYQRGFGTRVEATVLSCESSGNFRRYGSDFRTDCVAEWTIDGRTVIGGFTGGNGESDVGATVDATVRGDTAYSRSLVMPLLLIALGSPFLLLPVFAIRRRFRARN